MDDFDHIKHIVLQQLHRCVVCHREYEIGDITSLQRKPGVWTLMVECEQCHSRNYLAAVTPDGDPEAAMLEVRSLTQQAIREIGLPRERRSGEIVPEAPASGELVTSRDVLEMHEFLQEFDGDFARLFRSS
ncbi:MAG: hypothetical protein KC435_12335 [Thermomicrobiales bacterium]|nr:hypothetical protein [Thermomicrobiales bacterium]